MNDKYFEQMQVSLSQYSDLTKLDWEAINNIFRLVEYKRNSHIFSPGVETSSLFFVCSGLIRYYYLGDDGKEWNKAFVSENMLSASFSSDFLGHTSPFGIQTLEETILLAANLIDFEALYDKHPMIERLGRKFIELILISKMKRERSFLQKDGKTRYLDFSEQNPELVQRIPQYHLASYLGISEVSLSRICRTLARNNN